MNKFLKVIIGCFLFASYTAYGLEIYPDLNQQDTQTKENIFLTSLKKCEAAKDQDGFYLISLDETLEFATSKERGKVWLIEEEQVQSFFVYCFCSDYLIKFSPIQKVKKESNCQKFKCRYTAKIYEKRLNPCEELRKNLRYQYVKGEKIETFGFWLSYDLGQEELYKKKILETFEHEVEVVREERKAKLQQSK